MVEDTTVRARYGSAASGHSSEVGRAGNLDTGELVSLDVLFKVFNTEFASRGLDLHELVSLSSV